MSKIRLFRSLVMLEKLIRQRCTGTPDELAKRLSISRRALYDIIDELKADGIEIKYCRTRCSFYYNGDALLNIHFSVTEITDPEELKNISGGTKKTSTFLLPCKIMHGDVVSLWSEIVHNCSVRHF